MRDFFSLIPRLPGVPSPGCLAAIVAAGAIAGYLIAVGAYALRRAVGI